MGLHETDLTLGIQTGALLMMIIGYPDSSPDGDTCFFSRR